MHMACGSESGMHVSLHSVSTLKGKREDARDQTDVNLMLACGMHMRLALLCAVFKCPTCFHMGKEIIRFLNIGKVFVIMNRK